MPHSMSTTFWASHPYGFLAGYEDYRVSQMFVVIRANQGLEVGSGDGASAFQVDHL